MRGQRWTEADDARLRAEAPHRTFAEIGVMLGRSYTSVQKRAEAIGINRFRRKPQWSAAQDAEIRALFPDMPTGELAARMGLSRNAITLRAKRLGVVKSGERRREVGRKASAAAAMRRSTHAFHQRRAGRFDGQGIWTPTMDAVRFLQKLDPIWRCDEAGAFDPRGGHWKFRGRIYAADELRVRAARAGWVES